MGGGFSLSEGVADDCAKAMVHGPWGTRKSTPDPGIKSGKSEDVVWRFGGQSVEGDTMGQAVRSCTRAGGEEVDGGLDGRIAKAADWCGNPFQSPRIDAGCFNFPNMPSGVKALKGLRCSAAFFQFRADRANSSVSEIITPGRH